MNNALRRKAQGVFQPPPPYQHHVHPRPFGLAPIKDSYPDAIGPLQQRPFIVRGHGIMEQ
jgi:hypothetical protein